MRGLDGGDDLVLTPDQSGGYAMIGVRAPHPELFELAMSTDVVMEQTMTTAHSMGLRSSVTTPGFGLNTVEDFRFFDALSSELLSDLCPRTVELISSLPLDNVL